MEAARLAGAAAEEAGGHQREAMVWAEATARARLRQTAETQKAALQRGLLTGLLKEERRQGLSPGKTSLLAPNPWANFGTACNASHTALCSSNVFGASMSITFLTPSCIASHAPMCHTEIHSQWHKTSVLVVPICWFVTQVSPLCVLFPWQGSQPLTC